MLISCLLCFPSCFFFSVFVCFCCCVLFFLFCFVVFLFVFVYLLVVAVFVLLFFLFVFVCLLVIAGFCFVFVWGGAHVKWSQEDSLTVQCRVYRSKNGVLEMKKSENSPGSRKDDILASLHALVWVWFTYLPHCRSRDTRTGSRSHCMSLSTDRLTHGQPSYPRYRHHPAPEVSPCPIDASWRKTFLLRLGWYR